MQKIGHIRKPRKVKEVIAPVAIDFNTAITMLCEEKGISKDKVIETISAALAAAYKKDYGRRTQNIRAEFDVVSGGAKFFLIKEVVDETTREFVFTDLADDKNPDKFHAEKMQNYRERLRKGQTHEEFEETKIARYNPERDLTLPEARKIKKKAEVGDIIEIALPEEKDYGRVAAQTAKQVIVQRIREAERDSMFEEYKSKEGEVISGVVQRMEGRNVFMDIGKSVGIIFPGEQVRNENYRIGKRMKVFLVKVDVSAKGPGMILSRVHPEMVRKLFELEVPEIFAGTVVIKTIAREAGERTKVAVVSTEEGIDPIGSCVGQKGTRVQAVIDELGGEKIDIILWNEDIAKFIGASLSPAKVLRVDIDEAERKATIVVPDEQLSLAIGKHGQNVRLAAKLTGWRLDIIGAGVIKEADEAELIVEENTEIAE